MGHLSYEDAKKGVVRGLILLAVVTLIEVAISLFGKGHLGIDPSSMANVTIFGSSFNIILGIVGLLLIGLSLYKAYFIIYEFMHMGYEVKGLARSVLLPMLLLVWAIIAFLQEGNSWGKRRALIEQKSEISVEQHIKEDVKHID